MAIFISDKSKSDLVSHEYKSFIFYLSERNESDFSKYFKIFPSSKTITLK